MHGRRIDIRLIAMDRQCGDGRHARNGRGSPALPTPYDSMEKARRYDTVVGEWNARCGPDDGITQFIRRRGKEWVEGGQAAFEQRAQSVRGLQRYPTAKPALNGAETLRSICRADFETCEPGVRNEIRVRWTLFLPVNGRRAACPSLKVATIYEALSAQRTRSDRRDHSPNEPDRKRRADTPPVVPTSRPQIRQPAS